MDKSKYIKPRAYELMAILLPDQGDAETQAIVDTVVRYITDQQGTIDSLNSESPWGRRRLAYTIRHNGVDYRDGFYLLTYFTALPGVIGEIERELKLNTNVIRYLLLGYDENMGEQITEEEVVVEELTADEAKEVAADVAEIEEAAAEIAADVEAVEETVEDAVEAEEPAAVASDTEEPAAVAPAEEAAEDTAATSEDAEQK